MAKITAQELKDDGWTAEAFGKDAGSFDTWLDSAVIARAEAELRARLGDGVYDSTTAPTATNVTEAERALCEEILWQTRHRLKSQQVNAGGGEPGRPGRSTEQIAADGSRSRAEELIAVILDSGLALGLVESTHFDNSASVSGLETPC